WQHARNTGATPQVTIGQSAGPLAATRTALWHATADGYFISTTAMVPREARALARAAGVEHLLDDVRFREAPKFASADDAQAYEDAMWEPFRKRPLAEWLPILRGELDVAFEVAVTCEQALDHPQMVHNRDVVTVEHPVHGTMRMIGPLGNFVKTPSVIGVGAPALGHNSGPFEQLEPRKA